MLSFVLRWQMQCFITIVVFRCHLDNVTVGMTVSRHCSDFDDITFRSDIIHEHNPQWSLVKAKPAHIIIFNYSTPCANSQGHRVPWNRNGSCFCVIYRKPSHGAALSVRDTC